MNGNFSIFYGGITKTIPDGETNIEAMYQKIISTEFKTLCEKIQAVKNPDKNELKKERNKLKKHLSYVTVAGLFNERSNNNIISTSGFAAIDIDYVQNLYDIKQKLKDDKYIKLLFISPSGEGLKAIICIDNNIEDFKDRILTYYKYIHTTYNIDISSIDASTCDISRACYLSYDPDAIYNKNAIPFDKIEKNIEIFKTKDTSRSAVEYNKILKLIYSGRTKEYIYKVMNNSEKWKSSSDQYKEITYNKALDFSKVSVLSPEIKKFIIPEISKNIMEHNKIVSIRNDKSCEMWIYRDGIYIPQAITYIQEMCGKILHNNYDINIVNKIIDFIKKETYENPEVFFDEEDCNLICVENGVLNILNKKIEEFSDKYRFFNKLPIKYDITKDCPYTKQHFQTVLYEKDILLMQEIYGYLLYRKYNIQRAFLFSGNGGNGKGKTIEQMKNFIGIKNVVNISLSSLEQDKFIKGSLHKKLANLGADLGKTELKNTSTFRELTGEDLITAQRKFLSPIDFQNYAKMIFAVNTLPYIDENTDGFWRRWIYIDFPLSFLNKNDYEKKKNEGKLKHNDRIADINLSNKLNDESELSGVLNWALEGLHRLLKNEDFTYNKSYEETKLLMQKRESSSIAFMQDCLESFNDVDFYITNEEMYSFYRKYCLTDMSSLKVVSDLNFRRELNNHGYSIERKRTSNGYELRWYYVRFKKEVYNKIMENTK